MLVSALDLYLKILCTGRDCGWLSAPSRALSTVAPSLPLAGFQADGAQAVLAALDRFGGALLCDSPGLGKTRVALAVAAVCARRGAAPIFVLPATLVQVWRPLVESCGLPFEAVTHQALGHPSGRPIGSDEARLVVVDEAHTFRNPATRGYRRLARLCSGRRVLLVTATPVNNQVEDLYHLLRLFAGDSAFACLGVPSLRAAFRSGLSPGSASATLHDALRVLEAVMIRRTRADVVVAAAGLPDGLRFPERRLGELVPAPDLAGDCRFDALLAGLRRKAAAHPLLVSVLAKRLASGPVALARTLDRLCAWGRLRGSRSLAGWTPAMRRRLLETLDDEGGLQDLLPLEDEAADRSRPRPAGPAPDASLASLTVWLEPMRDEARLLARLPDGRATALEQLLGSELAGVKTVVFSEYRDTALWLYRTLAGVPRRAFLDGRGGLTASGRCSRDEVLRRFAPRTHSGPREAMPPEHEQVQVLFATDVLSEGLNLQEAAAVVSFDLPWNPVRLIQRAGRIDRLGSPHPIVQVFHLRPRPELDRLLRLTGRLLRKSGAIRATLGPAGEDRTLDAPGDTARPPDETGKAEGSRAVGKARGGAQGLARGVELPRSGSETGPGLEEAPAVELDGAGWLKAVLSADLGRFERLAPLALARAGRLPDGLVAPPSPPVPAGRPGMVACYLLDWPGTPGPSLEWFHLEDRAIRQGGLEESGLLRLRDGLAIGPFARVEPGPPSDWRALLEAAATRRLRRLASRSAAGAGPLSLPLRRLLALVQRVQRDCRTRPELLRSYEALERLLASPLDAGLEERLSTAARSRLGEAELPALARELLTIPGARPVATQVSRKVFPVRLLGAFVLG